MKGKSTKRLRRSAAESRERILKAALKLLSKHGWGGTSFQLIADSCQVSQSNVLYHFKTKEALLIALLGMITTNNYSVVTSAFKPEHTAFERLVIHFQKNLEWAEEFPEEAQVILLIYQEACHSKEFSKIFMQMLERAQGRIIEHLMAGAREGLFDSKINVKSLAQFIHNTLVGAFINLISSRVTDQVLYSELEVQSILKAMTESS